MVHIVTTATLYVLVEIRWGHIVANAIRLYIVKNTLVLIVTTAILYVLVEIRWDT